MYLLISTEKNTHFSVALGDEQGIKKQKTVKKPYQQSELLLDTIKQESKKAKKQQLTGVMVVKGPGDFSALRIGISTANALAYGFGVPVVGVLSRNEERGARNDREQGVDEEEKLAKVWEKGVELLKKAKLGEYVVPEYGREANIG